MSRVQKILNQPTPEGKVIIKDKCPHCDYRLGGHIRFEFSCGRNPCPECNKYTEVERE